MTPVRASSAGFAAVSGSPDTAGVLDELQEHLDRYIRTVSEADLDLMTLWIAHTHVVTETYTSPRLLIDSPMPGSGKTTVLDHCDRLALNPIMAASLSSPALVSRLLADGPRTILIDEADRSLDPSKEGVGELIAVLNSGYRRGGQRPVLAPSKDGGWAVHEMPTYGPVAIAGNAPALPDDTRSRCVRVLLMPDLDGTVEESDWELIEEPVAELAGRLAGWSDTVRETIRTTRPELPEGIKGRNREKWGPLMRVAISAGGHWPAAVDRLAIADLQRQESDREEGYTVEKPHVRVLRHLAAVWPVDRPFVPTETLIARLAAEHPEEWGAASPFGKPLTPQRLGRMLSRNFGLTTIRPDTHGARGYAQAHLRPVWRRLHMPHPGDPEIAAEPADPETPHLTLINLEESA